MFKPKSKEDRKKKIEYILKTAERADGQSEFVKGCREFFDNAGFLTEMQIYTLKQIQKERRLKK